MIINSIFSVGDIVMDGITDKRTTIIGITYSKGRKGPEAKCHYAGCFGYWVDDNTHGGGRHPWEISHIA